MQISLAFQSNVRNTLGSARTFGLRSNSCSFAAKAKPTCKFFVLHDFGLEFLTMFSFIIIHLFIFCHPCNIQCNVNDFYVQNFIILQIYSSLSVVYFVESKQIGDLFKKQGQGRIPQIEVSFNFEIIFVCDLSFTAI